MTQHQTERRRHFGLSPDQPARNPSYSLENPAPIGIESDRFKQASRKCIFELAGSTVPSFPPHPPSGLSLPYRVQVPVFRAASLRHDACACVQSLDPLEG